MHSTNSFQDLDFRLGKSYKLCSKKSIESTYRSGLIVKSYPFFSKYEILEQGEVSFQVLIVVPKKKYKLATSRNKIRRYIREGIRLNKMILEDFLKQNACSMNLYLAYHGEELDLDSSLKSINKLFKKIVKNISND